MPGYRPGTAIRMRILLGDPDGEARLDQAMAGFPLDRDLPPEMLHMLTDISYGYTLLDRVPETIALLEKVVAAAIARAGAGLVVWPVGDRGFLDYKAGRWREAYAGALEAERLGLDADWPTRWPTAGGY